MPSKLLLTLGLCLSLGITPAAEPETKKPTSRYQIINGQASNGKMLGTQVISEPATIRLDTQTGDTWILQRMTQPGKGLIWLWVPIPVAKPSEIQR